MFHDPDTGTYLAPAAELLREGTFTVHGEPELVRTPGYPLLLIPGVWLEHPELITIGLQIVLSVLTVIGVFVLARSLLGHDGVALLAAALYAIEPLSVLYTAKLVTETLFTCLVVVGLIPFVQYVRGGRLAILICGVATLAVSAYVRPAGYYLPFALLLVLTGHAVVTRGWNRLTHMLVAAATFIAVVAPWQLRNKALGFNGMSGVSALSMYFYNAAALRAKTSGTSFEAMQAAMGWNSDSVYFELHPEQRSWRPGRRLEFMGSEGAREVRADLVGYASVHLIGTTRVLLHPGAIGMLKVYGLYPPAGGLLGLILTEGAWSALGHLFRTNPLALALELAFGAVLALTYALALLGLVTERRWKEAAVVLVVATAAYVAVIGGGPAAEARFRHPLMPLVCVLAAAGLGAIAGRFSPRSMLADGTVRR